MRVKGTYGMKRVAAALVLALLVPLSASSQGVPQIGVQQPGMPITGGIFVGPVYVGGKPVTMVSTSCATVSNIRGGGTAGDFTTTKNGACTVTITLNGTVGMTAPVGWTCWANDITDAGAAAFHQTGMTTTTVTLTGTTSSASSIVNWGCSPY